MARPSARNSRGSRQRSDSSGPTLPGRLAKEIPGLNTTQKKQRGSFIQVSRRKADRKRSRQGRRGPYGQPHKAQGEAAVAASTAHKKRVRLSGRGARSTQVLAPGLLLLTFPVPQAPQQSEQGPAKRLKPTKPARVPKPASKPQQSTAPRTAFERLLQAEGWQVRIGLQKVRP